MKYRIYTFYKSQIYSYRCLEIDGVQNLVETNQGKITGWKIHQQQNRDKGAEKMREEQQFSVFGAQNFNTNLNSL